MKEPYGEGLASRPDPESCIESSQEAGEALTGEARAGLLSSERNEFQVPLLWPHGGGETGRDVKGESQPGRGGVRDPEQGTPQWGGFTLSNVV